MREYAGQQTAILLRRFAFQLNQAAVRPDADSIHDLRVSIRRLSRCLRVFSHFYPGTFWKKARTRLSALMHVAGDVRDCDIALELLETAGIPPQAAVVAHIQARRRTCSADLSAEIRRWKEREFSREWRVRLGLPTAARRRS